MDPFEELASLHGLSPADTIVAKHVAAYFCETMHHVIELLKRRKGGGVENEQAVIEASLAMAYKAVREQRHSAQPSASGDEGRQPG